MDPLSGCWPHWEKQLAAARREGVIEGLEDALSLVHDDEAVTRDLIRAEIERLREKKP